MGPAAILRDHSYSSLDTKFSMYIVRSYANEKGTAYSRTPTEILQSLTDEIECKSTRRRRGTNYKIFSAHFWTFRGNRSGFSKIRDYHEPVVCKWAVLACENLFQHPSKLRSFTKSSLAHEVEKVPHEPFKIKFRLKAVISHTHFGPCGGPLYDFKKTEIFTILL